jgi:hypothetical protein
MTRPPTPRNDPLDDLMHRKRHRSDLSEAAPTAIVKRAWQLECRRRIASELVIELARASCGAERLYDEKAAE